MDATTSSRAFHRTAATEQILGCFCLDNDGCCHQVFDIPESRPFCPLAFFVTGCQHIRRRHAHDEGLAEPCLRRLLVRSYPLFQFLPPLPPSSLTLTAALPVQTDPIEAAKVARAFGNHPCAQPGDIRLAGLTELVAILHEAAKSCGDFTLRRIDEKSLRRCNDKLNEWERYALLYPRLH